MDSLLGVGERAPDAEHPAPIGSAGARQAGIELQAPAAIGANDDFEVDPQQRVVVVAGAAHDDVDRSAVFLGNEPPPKLVDEQLHEHVDRINLG